VQGPAPDYTGVTIEQDGVFIGTNGGDPNIAVARLDSTGLTAPSAFIDQAVINGTRLFISSTAPTAVNDGDIWIDKSGIFTQGSSYALPKATASALGGVELFDATVQTVAANAVTTTASRTYGVQMNSADQLVVNVPWSSSFGYVGGYQTTASSSSSVALTDINSLTSTSTLNIATPTGAPSQPLTIRTGDGTAGSSGAILISTGQTTTISGGTSGNLTLNTGAGGYTANGSGNIIIQTGNGSGSSGPSGNITIDAGIPSAATAGTISIGNTRASAVTIGRAGASTTIAGTLTALPTLPSTAQQLFLASPTSGAGTPAFRYISTSDFTQSVSPTIGQCLVAAPVTGGWSWGSFISTGGGTLTGGLTIAATTSGINGLKLTSNTSGPLLTAGAVDFDGNAFFATPKVNNTTAGRGLIPTQQYFIPNAATTIVTSSGSTGTFTGNAMGNKSIYLAASTTYEVEAVLYVQHTWSATQTNNFTINLLYPTGSTALISGVGSYATSTSISGTGNQFALNSTTAVVISASPTSGNWYRVVLKGIIKTSTTAGNFSPVFGYTTISGSTTATNTIGANSFIKVNPIAGVGADINIGGWA
jgi:hypothetical protein